jgi:hypothetical protein
VPRGSRQENNCKTESEDQGKRLLGKQIEPDLEVQFGRIHRRDNGQGDAQGGNQKSDVNRAFRRGRGQRSARVYHLSSFVTASSGDAGFNLSTPRALHASGGRPSIAEWLKKQIFL